MLVNRGLRGGGGIVKFGDSIIPSGDSFLQLDDDDDDDFVLSDLESEAEEEDSEIAVENRLNVSNTHIKTSTSAYERVDLIDKMMDDKLERVNQFANSAPPNTKDVSPAFPHISISFDDYVPGELQFILEKEIGSLVDKLSEEYITEKRKEEYEREREFEEREARRKARAEQLEKQRKFRAERLEKSQNQPQPQPQNQNQNQSHPKPSETRYSKEVSNNAVDLTGDDEGIDEDVVEVDKEEEKKKRKGKMGIFVEIESPGLKPSTTTTTTATTATTTTPTSNTPQSRPRTPNNSKTAFFPQRPGSSSKPNVIFRDFVLDYSGRRSAVSDSSMSTAAVSSQCVAKDGEEASNSPISSRTDSHSMLKGEVVEYERDFNVVVKSNESDPGVSIRDSSVACFNCGGHGHSISHCPLPRDDKKVRDSVQARRQAGNDGRKEEDVRFFAASKAKKYVHFKPGVLSDSLKSALGMTKNTDPPPYLRRMLKCGYPPGFFGEYISGDGKTERVMTEELPGFNLPLHQEWENPETASISLDEWIPRPKILRHSGGQNKRPMNSNSNDNRERSRLRVATTDNYVVDRYANRAFENYQSRALNPPSFSTPTFPEHRFSPRYDPYPRHFDYRSGPSATYPPPPPREARYAQYRDVPPPPPPSPHPHPPPYREPNYQNFDTRGGDPSRLSGYNPNGWR